MMPTHFKTFCCAIGVAALGLAGCSAPAAIVPEAEFKIEPVAERRLTDLPDGALFWRVERLDSFPLAEAAAGRTGLVVDASGEAWLFTLAPAGEATPDAELIAEIGPIPIPDAPEYLLRINRAGGPPGAMTPVHTHAGAEAFLILSGQLSQRTAHGTMKLEKGATLPGHDPGMVMQLSSSGDEPLDQFVMFVVDATKPFSTPSSFE